jgi:hypothetical protein
VLPDRLVPFDEQLTAPDVVDENVEAPVTGADTVGERAHLVGNEAFSPVQWEAFRSAIRTA